MQESDASFSLPPLPYNPAELPRETARHYIPGSDKEIDEMLEEIGMQTLSDLYDHVPESERFPEAPALPEELSYEELQQRMAALAARNRTALSFIGDGLPNCSVPDIVPYVLNIRNLTTAYTPYQPERSQGTLMTHWIYQCLMSQLTGFEAINSSLYDRSTAIFEAICTAIRLARKADTVIVPQALYPGDIEVLRTLAAETAIHIVETPLDPATGTIDRGALQDAITDNSGRIAAIVIPQVNCLGIIEDVHSLTDLVHAHRARAIAVVDPLLLGPGGLVEPTAYGAKGADMIVGEAQHLALGPNFGGPGLGLFGIRFNDTVKNDIRQTPGRYVGKARDLNGRDCRVMVISTREQHIRKEKATSNICSNQAYLATIAGAALLSRGDDGIGAMLQNMRQRAADAFRRLTSVPGVNAAFPAAPFFNEFVLELPTPPQDLLDAARHAGIHAGVRVTERVPGRQRLLKISLSDWHSPEDIDRLTAVFEKHFGVPEERGAEPQEIQESLLRSTAPGLRSFPTEEIQHYYDRLGNLNATPDDAPYPLGSCTMKYNPYINDWAASLDGFTSVHPQAPVADVQGSLELLYEIQEWFKRITGLGAVTTQPVAGAQGELVGLKLFQAYHHSRGESHRDVVFIPKSAHGTNFATAIMAGFYTGVSNGERRGIVLLEADQAGQIDMDDFNAKLGEYGDRLAGVMITNPNTSGIFETHFKSIADQVHAAGGLMYMDGANMNAIAGWVDLGALGVDAVHNNLHKTWTIPHGGGGPGDAIVAVCDKLAPFLPGFQVEKDPDGRFQPVRPAQSIGSFHRHWGNFAHKVRCFTYLLRLGRAGVPRMSGVAVLASRYLYHRLLKSYPALPPNTEEIPRMHEFIITLSESDFQRIESVGIPRATIIGRVGKLFLDFGFHAPTVAWPETFGLMIEPTESYSRVELDRFAESVEAIGRLIREHPEVLNYTPFFTPVERIDDVSANRHLCLHEPIIELPQVPENRLPLSELLTMPVESIYRRIVEAAEARSNPVKAE